MKLFLLSSLIFATSSYGAVLTSVTGDNSFKDAPEFKAILEQLKPYGGFTTKVESVVERPKEMSQGQRLVEEAKARNRAILAQMRAEDQKVLDSKKSESTAVDMDQLKRETKELHRNWKKEVQATLAQWKKEQNIFLGRVKVYQNNTFEIPAPKEVITETKEIPRLPDAFVVSGAFQVPVRDQKDRPTCSAFSGVRAIEILMAQNKVYQDLSEQYFYWASKPACQTNPCTERGSWIVYGLDHSRSQRNVDIPKEDKCSYRAEPLPKNETQLPMSGSCREGVAQVVSYESVRTLADVINKIKMNIPVIVSAKLTPNFYLNQGLITLAEENRGRNKLDSHSLGHAFIAVGVLELPEKMKNDEGRYCLVVTNSWGRGWGAGGYSCITEKWMTKNRSQNAFVAITKIRVD